MEEQKLVRFQDSDGVHRTPQIGEARSQESEEKFPSFSLLSSAF